MAKKPLRVGFDLDGVLLYNPARIVRPLVVFIKRYILRKKRTTFFVPHTPFQKWMWRMFHYSSIFIAPGFDDVKKLVSEEKIEAYIITGRFNFLKNDFEKWLQRINAQRYFKKTVLNTKNEQPHLFKAKVVKELNLDVFIEDNWDIVQQLNKDSKTTKNKTKIFWIYNIFDHSISYQYKFPTLKNAVAYIKKNLV